ncbi:hypothetical protein C1924_19610 [Stenotrophomonas sp. ESTM1D_MKCIP4_1]|uniref:hypothetical protein n=1 Tax=Stenotrophomonas sp. ESTM1D_MKCIP4_1 TaxID=2072414 RepID=UPI000D541A56|nr:hypothetical protein [Stenotrophomonas sp. ESTM1D_MKCIP4_1]AWH55241.1 hypothetical protein C1924_19610 [Stenotrophomonas sp. ESTM1D_MKCIP4_1]
MSSPIPRIPTAPLPSTHRWISPLAQGSFWVCLLLTVYFLLQALVAWPLALSGLWKHLVILAWEHQFDRSLHWMLAHPVATSLLAALLCLTSTVASWGLWKERRWGLWAFIWALLWSALANFAITWWFDRVLKQIVVLLADDPATAHELNVQRLLFTLTLLGTSVLFAGLQGWLAWRLLQPDIRARFR